MPKSSSAVRPSGMHEEVAAVQVAVEDAVDHGALDEARSCPVRTTASVSMPAACMPATSSKVKPSSRSITSTRRVTSVGCGRGHDVAALAQLGEHRGDVEHVLGLEAEVELLDDRLGEQLDERGRVGRARRSGCGRRGAARATPSPRRSLRTSRRDRRPLHLDHDLLAGAQAWPRAPGRSTRPRAASRSNAANSVSSGRRGRPRRRARTVVERLGAAPGRGSCLNSVTSSSGKRPSPRGDDLAELDVGRAEAARPRGAGAATGPRLRRRSRPAAGPTAHSHGTMPMRRPARTTRSPGWHRGRSGELGAPGRRTTSGAARARPGARHRLRVDAPTAGRR